VEIPPVADEQNPAHGGQRVGPEVGDIRHPAGRPQMHHEHLEAGADHEALRREEHLAAFVCGARAILVLLVELLTLHVCVERRVVQYVVPAAVEHPSRQHIARENHPHPPGRDRAAGRLQILRPEIRVDEEGQEDVGAQAKVAHEHWSPIDSEATHARQRATGRTDRHGG
jgi:hypothetical protein